MKKKSGALLRKGTAQFSGQALGLILALLVSHLIARRLGVGPEADAFILGRRLITAVTETLNQVVGIVFIPMVAAQAAAGAGIWSIVRRSAGPAFLLGVCLTVAFALSASLIISAVAGDLDRDTQALAERVFFALSLALPATIATMALAAYCNVKGIFGTPAAIKQTPRAAVALALMVAVQGNVAVSAAWSFTAANFGVVGITLALTVWLSKRQKEPIAPKTKPKQFATVRRSWAALILAFAALGFLWMETFVAAKLGPGSVATLDFGQRLGALLGNTLGAALALVVFADLSRRAASGEHHELGNSFRRALIIGMALIIPVAAGVAVNAGALVDLVLGYGAFAEDGQRDEVVLLVQLMAAAPVTAFGLRMMLVRIVAENELPMVRLLAVAMIADFISRIFLFSILTPRFGLAGIPLTLIMSPLLPAVISLFWMRGRGVFRGRNLDMAELRSVILMSAMTVTALVIGAWVAPMVVSGLEGKYAAVARLALSGGAGLAVIAFAVVGLKVKTKLT